MNFIGRSNFVGCVDELRFVDDVFVLIFCIGQFVRSAWVQSLFLIITITITIVYHHHDHHPSPWRSEYFESSVTHYERGDMPLINEEVNNNKHHQLSLLSSQPLKPVTIVCLMTCLETPKYGWRMPLTTNMRFKFYAIEELEAILEIKDAKNAMWVSTTNALSYFTD